MTREELRVKALLAFAHAGGLGIIPDDGEKWDEDIANGMDAAIAIIRAEVLEEAARVPHRLFNADGTPAERRAADEIAAAIRALKEKPQS